MFFVPDKVGGWDLQVVVQKETRAWWVQVEIVDMMIGIDIDGVFIDMQVSSVTRDNTRDVEEGEEVLAIEMEGVNAIVDIEALKNDGEAFKDWLSSLLGFKIVQHNILPI